MDSIRALQPSSIIINNSIIIKECNNSKWLKCVNNKWAIPVNSQPDLLLRCQHLRSQAPTPNTSITNNKACRHKREQRPTELL